MTRKQWSDKEVEALKILYPNNYTDKVAEVLGRSSSSISNRANAIGLKKSQEFMERDLAARSDRAKTDHRILATQIKKGAKTWNKGIKGSTGLHPNCRKHQFAKGRPPSSARNYKPIGTLRLNKDGLLERKVTDDHPTPARRWKTEHVLVWEHDFGAVPDGHIVIFKKGLRTSILEEITIDRLECISRAENARRNHPKNKSPELAKLTQLKGAITRQVNRIIKESKQ